MAQVQFGVFIKSNREMMIRIILPVAVGIVSALDINQKVYIEGQAVIGDGSGEGALNTCRPFASQHVSNAARPEIKVCGTHIKVIAFLRGRCAEYYEHHQVVGSCDTTLPTDSCQSLSPADVPTMGHYQSYLIEQC